MRVCLASQKKADSRLLSQRLAVPGVSVSPSAGRERGPHACSGASGKGGSDGAALNILSEMATPLSAEATAAVCLGPVGFRQVQWPLRGSWHLWGWSWEATNHSWDGKS